MVPVSEQGDQHQSDYSGPPAKVPTREKGTGNNRRSLCTLHIGKEIQHACKKTWSIGIVPNALLLVEG